MNTFAIDIAEAKNFKPGAKVNSKDRHGNPIKGVVDQVKEGNRVALVILRPRQPDAGNA